MGTGCFALEIISIAVKRLRPNLRLGISENFQGAGEKRRFGDDDHLADELWERAVRDEGAKVTKGRRVYVNDVL
ncbi:hypothetical protein E2C01_099378 [Portunus trituberculatus]|uniref:Uncharacterized protein n=1 Tax=Portunus trituberculatus TaxID=210409 RepID=A0A5B7KER8_PORTR|nr:hypothetical protein [Portunus trituberculatus]